MFSSPLGLGPTARELWTHQYAEAIGRALRAFGDRPSGRKAEHLEALLARLADPDRIRRVASSGPRPVADALHRMVWGGTDDEVWWSGSPP